MKTTSPERLVPEIFASADVAVNGSRPWDIQVHHHLFYKRLAAVDPWPWAKAIWTAGGTARPWTSSLLESCACDWIIRQKNH